MLQAMVCTLTITTMTNLSEHDITIRNVDVINPGQHGIWIDDPTNLLIEGGSITGVKNSLQAPAF